MHWQVPLQQNKNNSIIIKIYLYKHFFSFICKIIQTMSLIYSVQEIQSNEIYLTYELPTNCNHNIANLHDTAPIIIESDDDST